ncbi:MAG TPA: S41 family peptidase [Pyrinomonadaceae bacterium]|nr:S41 family peptidase [Pyrinomonadaceae bacterium]
MQRKHCAFNRALRLLLAAFICVSSGALWTARAQSIDPLERARANDMLKVLKDDIKKNYYDASYHGMDVDARFKTAEEKLKQANSLGQAFGIIAQVLLDLDDSHTFFLPPPRPGSLEYGWRMQMVGDKCFVTAIKPGSDAEKKGLKVGDEVLAINKFHPSRKEYWKMEYYYYALAPQPALDLVVQSPDGQQREVAINAHVVQGKAVLNLTGTDGGTDINDYIREIEDSDRLQRHRFEEFGGAIVWKMPGFDFDPDQVEAIMSGRIKGHSALILDLRGNQGGYVVTLERLAGYFFDHDLKIADLKGRKEMKPMMAKTRGKGIFDGKLVVLVDSRSASAAEIFARLVQLEKRGVVIGDRTSGAVMQARSVSHEMGFTTVINYGASITNADVLMSDGKSVEHVGVVPDEMMLLTGEDLATHRDPVMSRAAALLGINLDPAKAGLFFPIEWKK